VSRGNAVELVLVAGALALERLRHPGAELHRGVLADNGVVLTGQIPLGLLRDHLARRQRVLNVNSIGAGTEIALRPFRDGHGDVSGRKREGPD
jgi:hypothetical protein